MHPASCWVISKIFFLNSLSISKTLFWPYSSSHPNSSNIHHIHLYFPNTQLCEFSNFFSPLSTDYVAQLFLGVEAALKCGKHTRAHIIIENKNKHRVMFGRIRICHSIVNLAMVIIWLNQYYIITCLQISNQIK